MSNYMIIFFIVMVLLLTTALFLLVGLVVWLDAMGEDFNFFKKENNRHDKKIC